MERADQRKRPLARAHPLLAKTPQHVRRLGCDGDVAVVRLGIRRHAAHRRVIAAHRALGREPETRDAFFTEVDAARGADPALDRESAALAIALDDRANAEFRARDLVERMTLLLQASILRRGGHDAVATAFCASRLGGQHGAAFGTLEPGPAIDVLIERAGVEH